ncbi:sirohydrochlorin chelatase [Psychromonas sp. Urea-02u-13]|uniref:sirohydrochlorin chelatase n=1 Tax=Psychromonas sp. Urea-02u-13 TaxID=2058326 RepID=UPI000C3403A6|nr:sirohydrochlorin chelatase [Psychromonas sp. Urea-02u-13]PKG40962.1 sirohydrochlorin chelatase [Psychromonas sp. Urea-02u-13]
MNAKVAKKGIMVCGHGSRDKDAEMEFGLVAQGLKKRFPDMPIEYGFLEYSAPNIHMGLNSLIAQGVDHIYAVPGMLFAATHAKNDIPSVLTTFEDQNAGLNVSYGQELGLQKPMIEAFQARIYESLGLDASNPPAELYDTMLVVVGRGTSDSEANAEAAKLTRIVSENMGFGWADTVYSGVTYPSVGVGLEKLLKLGYKRIVVAPYFLFTGRLIKRIYGYIDKVASENPGVEFIKAGYLRDHEKVIDAFEFRVREIMENKQSNDENLMDTFKRRLAAGEIDVHHHHAEYQDPALAEKAHTHDHSHDHSHEHSHSHSHSHADNHANSHAHSHDNVEPHSHGVYKHIWHPLGPRTMIGEGICNCFMSQFPKELLDEEIERINNGVQGEALAHRK